MRLYDDDESADVTPTEFRDYWRNEGTTVRPEDVRPNLENIADYLARVRELTRTLKDRPDIGQEEREIAGDIWSGLAVWSELIFDDTEVEEG